LEKRVLVALPELEARVAMIRQHLTGRAAADVDFTEVRKVFDVPQNKGLGCMLLSDGFNPLRPYVNVQEGGNFIPMFGSVCQC